MVGAFPLFSDVFVIIIHDLGNCILFIRHWDATHQPDYWLCGVLLSGIHRIAEALLFLKGFAA
jgi:hypothetical protein